MLFENAPSFCAHGLCGVGGVGQNPSPATDPQSKLFRADLGPIPESSNDLTDVDERIDSRLEIDADDE